MRCWALGLLLLPLAGCLHGHILGDTTDESDRELSSFAEARQRAATFYEGRDYVRAAAQYQEALKIRPKYFMCQLGLAYSLMYTNLPKALREAETEFKKIGERRDPKEEVKRVYGLGLTYRALASHYQRRSRLRDQKGEVKGATEDKALSFEYAQKGIVHLKRVMEFDLVFAKEQDAQAAKRKVDPAALVPYRVTASLTPDAHLGIAHCEILLMDPSQPEELAAHEQRAEENLQLYTVIAANARKFWELERERLLVVDPMKEQTASVTLDDGQKRRYEERIANTIKQEVAMRQALFDTLVYVNRFPEAIAEANTILTLEPGLDQVIRDRATAYLFLEPPDRRAALRDLKEYRSRLPVDQLTDEMVQINVAIKQLEREIAKEPQPAGG